MRWKVVRGAIENCLQRLGEASVQEITAEVGYLIPAAAAADWRRRDAERQHYHVDPDRMVASGRRNIVALLLKNMRIAKGTKISRVRRGIWKWGGNCKLAG